MVSGRDAFIAELRRRLTSGIPSNPIRPVTPAATPPPVEYVPDARDPVTAFTEEATALGVTVEDAEGHPGELARRVCAEREVRSAVVSDDPECSGLTAVLQDAGISLAAAGDLDGIAAADIGITGASYGIARTGSLVVDSGRAGARTASLLPPIHLALLRREAVLPDVGTLLRDLEHHLPGGLPSNLVLITGPSKSADIELQLTVGMHGPRELIVGLM